MSSDPSNSVTAVTSWKLQFQQAIRDPLELCRHLELPAEFHEPARLAAELFPVFAPLSYVDRMRRGDPNDPLLRQVLPLGEELKDVPGFVTDPVDDKSSKHRPGLIQKYAGRVLLITTGTCAIHCRYCFRRHYPYSDEPAAFSQWQPAIDYVAADESIHEVILSGGDPLSLGDARLEELIDALGEIQHLRRLRLHTRLPIVLPDRVTDDLLRVLVATPLQSFVVVHANHVNELSHDVLFQIKRMRESGVTLLNQSVLLRGVNDSVIALAELCETLSDNGVLPYYLSQLDRVSGAAHFEVPVEDGLRLIEQLRAQLPGYAVPRFVQENAGEASKSVLL